MDNFNLLVRLAGIFVDRQKGMWDHYDWLDFLSEIHKREIDVSEQMQELVGSLLENMKEFQLHLFPDSQDKELMSDISEHTINFITNKKGFWDHNDWMTFLSDIYKIESKIADDAASQLGEVLESAKKLYNILR